MRVACFRPGIFACVALPCSKAEAAFVAADPKHLEFIQGVITRLAGNSFQMKAWNVALATAAIGFAAAKDSHPAAAAFAVVPSIAFWFLDGYYLGLEVLYRDLYKAAVDGTKTAFDMDAGTLSFARWLTELWSGSVAGLHLPMIAIILVVTLARPL